MLYFIAIVAPGHIDAAVLVWKKYMEQEYGCKVALRSPAHITLIPPFSMARENEPALIEELQQFSAASFDIRLKNFDSFKPKVIFLHVEPNELLSQLKAALGQFLIKDFPIKKDDRPFHPHITIANRDLRKNDFGKAWAYFQSLLYEAVFSADNISLLRHNNKEWEIAASVNLI